MTRLTDQQKIDIVEKYKSNNCFCVTLAKEYGVSERAISNLLKRRNVTVIRKKRGNNRKYTLNENYFDIIDSEEKAYFLGLLYADGYNNDIIGAISLNLAEYDYKILELFNHRIESNRPIKTNNISNKNPNWANQCKLRINSFHMSEQLTKLGCTPRKSLTLQFPTEEQVPKHLLRHWLRGMWDGDGSISYSFIGKYKTLTLSCSICSSSYCCEKIKTMVKKELNINSCIYKPKHCSEFTNSLAISGNLQGILFFEWLYKDATIYLQRKYDKYQEFINEYNKTDY